MYKLVVFDVAGTIVSDDGVVIAAFEQAFREVVPELWAQNSEEFTQYAKVTMGQAKIEVFEHLLRSRTLAEEAAQAFQTYYLSRLSEVMGLEGIEQMFRSLRENGIKIALNTGFNRETLDQMIENLGWSEFIDATATPSETKAGRPSPAMLEYVCRQMGINDPLDVAILGDTESDIESGIRFGAGLKIGVLSGAHDEETLLAAGADLVVRDATYAIENLLD
jgi:phosphonatase-like hydrolase